jgi:hypothetical protein
MHLELLGRFPSHTVSTYVDIFILAAKKQVFTGETNLKHWGFLGGVDDSKNIFVLASGL